MYYLSFFDGSLALKTFFFFILYVLNTASTQVLVCYFLPYARYSLNSGGQQVPTEMPLISYFKHKRITPHGTGTQMWQGLICLMGTKLFSFYIK
jgi:hypothetical protein